MFGLWEEDGAPGNKPHRQERKKERKTVELPHRKARDLNPEPFCCLVTALNKAPFTVFWANNRPYNSLVSSLILQSIYSGHLCLSHPEETNTSLTENHRDSKGKAMKSLLQFLPLSTGLWDVESGSDLMIFYTSQSCCWFGQTLYRRLLSWSSSVGPDSRFRLSVLVAERVKRVYILYSVVGDNTCSVATSEPEWGN